MDTSKITLSLNRPQWSRPNCPTLQSRQDHERFDRDQDGYRQVDTFLKPFKQWEQKVVAADQTAIDAAIEKGKVVIGAESIQSIGSDYVNAELCYDSARGDVGDYLIVQNPNGLPERSYSHRLSADREEYRFNARGMDGVAQDSLLVDHKLGTMTLIKQFEPDQNYPSAGCDFG